MGWLVTVGTECFELRNWNEGLVCVNVLPSVVLV
jgi:hypothetical protein